MRNRGHEVLLFHVLAHQSAAFGDLHLHQVLARRLADLLEHVFAFREQPARKEQQVSDSQQRTGKTHGADLEQAHRTQGSCEPGIGRRCVDHHPVHHQVGAGADQGSHAAENGQERKRDEEA